MRDTRIALAVSLLTVALMGASATAQTTNWTAGAGTSDWGTAGNWDNGVPNAATDATITTSLPAPTTSAGAACLDLVVDAGATLTIGGGAPIDVNGHCTVNGTVTGGDLLRFVGAGTVTNPGGNVLPAIEVAATGQTVWLGSDMTMPSLTLTDGVLRPSNAAIVLANKAWLAYQGLELKGLVNPAAGGILAMGITDPTGFDTRTYPTVIDPAFEGLSVIFQCLCFDTGTPPTACRRPTRSSSFRRLAGSEDEKSPAGPTGRALLLTEFALARRPRAVSNERSPSASKFRR